VPTSSAEIAYLIPYLLSLGLSWGILIYAWRFKKTKGAKAYSLYLLGQSLMILGFIIELASAGLRAKIFWDSFQWLASVLGIIGFPIFAVQYSERKLRWPRATLAFFLFIPALFTLLLLTDGWHRLIYAEPSLNSAAPFPELIYPFTPVVYAFSIFVYASTIWGIVQLVRRAVHAQRFYSAQVWIIIVGFLIPIIGTILTILGVQFTPQRDATPFTFALGNLIVAWGLFRFRIFALTPVGRDSVFEAMVDPVVILDAKHAIVDINPAMLDLLGLRFEETIGQSAKKVFADFPIPIKLYTDVTYARAEASFTIRDKTVFYELSVWPLIDMDRNVTGRVYVSHDITALKELENDLRGLNQLLEQRVVARTRELAEAYDTTLEGWALALELRDKETEGHSRRVTETTIKVARALDIPEEQIVHIRRGAILHDIGKMAIPDDILRKAGPLTEADKKIVAEHPITAHRLLSRIPFLQKAGDIPYCHHEKWDGTGYPRGLKGREIPLAARIFAVVDVWDAVQSERPYKKAWSREEALAYLESQVGLHFDPQIVDLFLRLARDGRI
jgi:PAS domain S-box-containing protein/putative nucleotidyltransferase with HDIG domain